jgi:hypothetical protein
LSGSCNRQEIKSGEEKDDEEKQMKKKKRSFGSSLCIPALIIQQSALTKAMRLREKGIRRERELDGG